MRYQETLCISHPILEGWRRGIIASDVPEHPEHISEACLQALPESHSLASEQIRIRFSMMSSSSWTSPMLIGPLLVLSTLS